MPFRRPHLQQQQEWRQQQHYRNDPPRPSSPPQSQVAEESHHVLQMQGRLEQTLNASTPSTSTRRLSLSHGLFTPARSSTLSYALDMHNPPSSGGSLHHESLSGADESPLQALLSEEELYHLLGSDLSQPIYEPNVEASNLQFEMVHPLPLSSQTTTQTHHTHAQQSPSSLSDHFAFHPSQHHQGAQLDHDQARNEARGSTEDELPILALTGLTSTAPSGMLDSPFSLTASRSGWTQRQEQPAPQGSLADTSPTSHLSRQPLHTESSLMQRFRQPSLHRQMTDPSITTSSASAGNGSGGRFPGDGSMLTSSFSMQPMTFASFGNRPRASTSASSHTHTPSDADRESTFISPSSSNNTVSGAPLNSAISTSLSAELAGLGLGVDGLQYSSASHALHDVTMDEVGAQPMKRVSSSSSSSTTRTRRGADVNESSFFSQNASSMDSSGMDDSLLSLRSAGGDHPNATASSSRWIHGRDTPPSSPAPSVGPRSRPGVTSIHIYPTADEFGRVADPKSHTHIPVDWSNTWPRTGGSVEVLGSSTKQATQMHHSLSHSAVTGDLSPPVDLRLAGRSHSSMSAHHQTQQDDRRAKRNSRSFAGTSPLLESTARRGSLTTARRSNDSLHSDLGPAKSNRLGAEAIQQRRAKRMSASIPSEYEARRLHQEKQSQYDQVSDALDTLRRFLYQREGTSTPSTRSSRPTSFIDVASGSGASSRGAGQPSMAEQVSRMLSQQQETQQNYHSTAQQQQQRPSQQRSFSSSLSPGAPTLSATKKLRHPPSGALPPRGTIFASPSGLQPAQLSPVPLEGKSVEAEHIATLEDLAKRVRQMKHDNQRLLDDL